MDREELPHGDVLRVLFEDRRVGELRRDDAGACSFRYAPQWREDGFAISLSLPLDDREHGETSRRFFANLLPEGQIRALVARRLGISEDNDWELLAALGGDCAGALTLTDDPDATGREDYRELPLAELQALTTAPHPGLAAVGGEDDLRLSLAGAQDKLPVCRTDDGDYLLPRGTAPSTHILKFAGADFAHLTANEVWTTDLAARLGLPVAHTWLDTRVDPPVCVVERYDRAPGPDGRVRRIHQEDFCQALGLPHTRKYEAEGGPDLRSIAAILEEHVADPAGDTRALIRWIAFCVLAGNADGHGKNLSLLYDGAAPRLSPFYDLVCTAAYPGLSRRLALSVAGDADPGTIARPHWLRLGEQLGVRPAYVVDLVDEISAAAPDAVEESNAAFRDRYGDHAILQMVPPVVRQRIRRTRTLLRR